MERSLQNIESVPHTPTFRQDFFEALMVNSSGKFVGLTSSVIGIILGPISLGSIIWCICYYIFPSSIFTLEIVTHIQKVRIDLQFPLNFIILC